MAREKYNPEGFRINLSELRILRLLLINPTRNRSGYEISKILGITVRSVYDILHRMEGAGWIRGFRESSHRQPISPKYGDGGAPRKLYRLTENGHSTVNQSMTMISQTEIVACEQEYSQRVKKPHFSSRTFGISDAGIQGALRTFAAVEFMST